MNLEEKLATINEPKISKIKIGSAKTISDFWSKFIEPNLLPEKVVSEWWKLLKRYVDDKGIVLAIRAFRGRSKSAREKIKDDELRGGFYTITGSTYNYFYTDNYFTAYFYKMAMDGFCPTYSEFKKMMVSRKFPARFGQSSEPERKRAAFIIDGTDPGISTAGYKISHIFDVGSGIWDGEKYLDMAKVCEKFFRRGKYKDWTLHNDSYGDFYARDLGVKPEAEKLIKAIFLRMTCPLNYVLTPKKDLHTTEVKVEKNDIGECRQLQQYAMFKFHEKYGKLYTDYLKEIGLGKDPVFSKASENFVVGIKYGPSKIAGEKKTKTEKKQKLSKAKVQKNAVDHNKVQNRIAGWATRTDSKVHKILKAFFAVCRNGKALVRDVEQKCSNVHIQNFGGSLASLKTDAGNSYGKVFEQSGDYIKICEEARAIIEEYRDCFS